MGPLGRKVVTPNPPFSAVGGAERGVRGHNFSTQWSHCFGFGPSQSPFLVLASPGAHFWFWEALKGGSGSQLFDPMEPVDEKFWVWPLPELVSGKLVRIYPPVRI